MTFLSFTITNGGIKMYGKAKGNGREEEHTYL